MWVSDGWRDYELIDCGGGEKLERWGKHVLVRPEPQAIWQTPRNNPIWRRPAARYARASTGGGAWEKKDVPAQWQVRYRELTFQVKPMNFKPVSYTHLVGAWAGIRHFPVEVSTLSSVVR